MDLAQLRQFAVVAERGNLSHAAQALQMSQPGLSKSMQRLQRAFGARIYARRGRGIELTDSGHALLKHAKLIESQLRDARAEVTAVSGGEVGHIRIGAGPAWLSRYLPLAIARVLSTRPQVQFTVEAGFPDQLTRRLKQGDIDLVLAGLPSEVDDELECIRLANDTVCVVARSGHPLRRKRGRTVADYQRYRWILPGREVPARTRLEAMFTANGVAPPRPAVETDSLALIMATLRITDCLGFATVHALEHDDARGIASLDHRALSFSRDAGVIYRRQGFISAAGQVLIAELRQIATRFAHV